MYQSIPAKGEHYQCVLSYPIDVSYHTIHKLSSTSTILIYMNISGTGSTTILIYMNISGTGSTGLLLYIVISFSMLELVYFYNSEFGSVLF
jgi:hypothetical protein